MNIKRWSVALASTLALGVLAAPVVASDDGDSRRSKSESKERAQKQQATEERVYGSGLMTREERREYRERIRNAATPEERGQIRREHHEKMKARAKERGVKLPDEPPAAGQGAGPGPGMSGGMGGGMGGGYRR